MNSRQLAVLGALAFVWGASFLFIKVLIDAGVEPAGVSGGRSALGALSLVPVVYYVRHQIPRSAKTWAGLAFLGFINFALPWTLFSLGESHAPSGVASVANACQPLAAALFSIALLKMERLTPARVTGLALGLMGVVALMGKGLLESDASTTGGILAMLGATACYGFGSVFIRRWMHDVPPIPLAAAQVSFSALFLAPVAFASGAYSGVEWGAGPVLSLLVLGGIGSGIAIVGFMWLIQQVGPVRAAVVTYLMPPVGVFLGWLVLDEPIGWNLLLGLGFIISGVALVQQVPVLGLLRRLSPQRGPIAEPTDG